MPSGAYLVDPDAAGPLAPRHGIPSGSRVIERFSCAPGPAGWRYSASTAEERTGAPRGRVDITVDSRWRQVRVEVRSGGWTVRGGVAGREVLWVRAGTGGAAPAGGAAAEDAPAGGAAAEDAMAGVEAAEHRQEAAGFGGASPGFLVAAARLLRVAPGSSAALVLVALGGDALGTRTVRQRWTLVDVTEHAADAGSLRVEQYEVADLDDGTVSEVHLAGDVVLAAPGIELQALESPPTPGPG